jgi:hypothetical protein
MNLVRLGMIVTLGLVAYYALTIYAGMPAEKIGIEPTIVNQTVAYMCPAVDNRWSGQGAIIVAVASIAGALGVAAADLSRRVY